MTLMSWNQMMMLSAVNRVIGYPLAQIEEDEFSVKIGWLSAVTEDINAFFNMQRV